MRRRPLVRYIAAAVVLSGFSFTAYAADWLQFGYDQAHSGFNSAESSYPVASQTTGQKFALHAVGSATGLTSDAAPIYLSGVVTPSGTKNVLYVVTTNGTLLALDAGAAADNQGNIDAVLWSHQPSTQQTNEGTSGSPAIDPNRQFVYAYALDGKVHKYKVGDGTETVAGGWPQVATAKPSAEKGASALAFSTPPGGTNYLYHVTNGYDGDGGDYQGHVTTINLSSGAQTVFNVMCSNLMNTHFVNNGTPKVDDCNILGGPGPGRAGQMGGIWGRPGTIYDAQTNRILIATGNGIFDANVAGNFEWGDSVLALNPDGSGSGMGFPVDSYTPSEYATLYGNDTDLGSTAPAILPSTSAQFPHLAIQSGKDHCVRLINLDDMSGAGGPAHTGGELNAATSCSTDAISSHVVFPQPAVWVNPVDHSTWAYVVSHSGAIQAYQLNVTGTPSLTKKWVGAAGRSPVIAGRTLYYVSGNAVLALDTLTGTQLWSGPIGSTHWQSPIIVNHHVYVADSSAKLWSFDIDGIFQGKFD
ncbi:MAG: PQQ-binding-like beta-propeller repeat protein [Rudaea sp.]